jgi:hypothetical protein
VGEEVLGRDVEHAAGGDLRLRAGVGAPGRVVDQHVDVGLRRAVHDREHGAGARRADAVRGLHLPAVGHRDGLPLGQPAWPDPNFVVVSLFPNH